MKTRLFELAAQSTTQMMSFVLCTEKGRLVVIDGGTTADADYLLETLTSLAGGKPTITTWFFTHPHCDHTGAFLELFEHHADAFKVDRIYCQFPETAFIEANEPISLQDKAAWDRLFPQFETLCAPLSTGDQIQVDNLTFDILYTHNPAHTNNAVNNSSAVIRLTVEGQRILFLGDLGAEAGNQLLAEQGCEGLRSTLCQMAHHGQNGVSRAVYEAIAPQGCLWCTPEWLWNNDAGQGYNTHSWQTIIVRQWMNELGVKHHYVNKDGTHTLELPWIPSQSNT